MLERIIKFFKIEVAESLAVQAWDKWAEIKESTQEQFKEALSKKNIIELDIEPRMLIIPVNKYDIKNSRLLTIDIGAITIINGYKFPKYKDSYLLNIESAALSHYNNFNDLKNNINNKFEILPNTKLSLTFALLEEKYSSNDYANIMIYAEIDTVKLNLTNKIYATLMFMIDIFQPTTEIDLWSQMNENKADIKRNCKISGNIWKRNLLYRNYEEYFAVLSGGYIYFYKNADDEEYEGYYYIKDSELIESIDQKDELTLKNIFNICELNIPEKHLQWKIALTERINEMKRSFAVKENDVKDYLSKKKINVHEIYFGFELNINNILIDVLESINNDITCAIDLTNKLPSNESLNEMKECENVKLFSISVQGFKMNLFLKDLDIKILLSLSSIQLFDETAGEKDFYRIIDSQDPENVNSKLLDLEINISDANSPNYQNVQISMDIKLGYLLILWNSIKIRSILQFFAHNDIYRFKVWEEIQHQADKQFLNLKDNNDKPNKNIARVNCKDSKYLYLKLITSISKVKLRWIQPILGYEFMDLLLDDTKLNVDMTEDHFTVKGSLGKINMIDLSNYPYTITNHSEYNSGNNKSMVKSLDNQTAIDFEYLSMNKWCKLCSDSFTSDVKVKINPLKILYIHEHFFRFFNYFTSEFLGSLGPSENVKTFKSKQNQVNLDIEEYEFMKLNVVILKPQGYLKARSSFNDYIKIDADKIIISCKYTKNYEIYREESLIDDNLMRYLTTYKFELKNLVLKTQSDFILCEPIDSIINMHFPYLLKIDKDVSDDIIDRSFQFDVYINNIDLNLRQKDFMNLMKIMDLNILYTDGQNDFYNYEVLNEILIKDNSGSINLNLLRGSVQDRMSIKGKKPLDEKILDSLDYLKSIIIIPNITLLLYDHNNKPFNSILLIETEINFYKRLSTKKEIFICIENLEFSNILDNNVKELILLEFFKEAEENKYNDDVQSELSENDNNFKNKRSFLKNFNYSNLRNRKASIILNANHDLVEVKKLTQQSYDHYAKSFENSEKQVTKLDNRTKKQVDLKITICKEFEKSYILTLTGLKIFIRLDSILLLKQFFIEGFPYYDENDKDLPNAYDSNEENVPEMRVYLEIKNPLLCVLTDNMLNSEQDLICLTSEIVCGYRRSKISQVKKRLKDYYKELSSLRVHVDDNDERRKLDNAIINDKSDIYSLTVSLFEINPFICKLKDVMNNDNDAKFNKIQKRKIMENFMLNYDSKTLMQFVPPNNYIISNENKFDLNKMTIKASYKDFVVFLKSTDYNNKLIGDEYNKRWEEFLNYTKIKNLKLLEKESGLNQDVNINKSLSSLSITENNKSPLINTKNPFVKKDSIKFKRNTLQINENDQIEQDLDTDLVETDDRPNISNLATKIKTNAFIKYKPKDIIIDKGISKTCIVSQGLQLVLIDDHANTYYPFLSVVVQHLNIQNDNLNFKQSQISGSTQVKVYTYNYIAGVWEPFIEKTHIDIEAINDYNDDRVKTSSIIINIPVPVDKPNSAFNINLSDLTVNNS